MIDDARIILDINNHLARICQAHAYARAGQLTEIRSRIFKRAARRCRQILIVTAAKLVGALLAIGVIVAAFGAPG